MLYPLSYEGREPRPYRSPTVDPEVLRDGSGEDVDGPGGDERDRDERRSRLQHHE